MPLPGRDDVPWRGWLVDGQAGAERQVGERLFAALTACALPDVRLRAGQHHMWGKADSLYIDIHSTMEARLVGTLHIHAYGNDLWIGRAMEPRPHKGYHQTMHWEAMVTAIDRCVERTVSTITARSEPAVL
jgi:hypothetical protein